MLLNAVTPLLYFPFRFAGTTYTPTTRTRSGTTQSTCNYCPEAAICAITSSSRVAYGAIGILHGFRDRLLTMASLSNPRPKRGGEEFSRDHYHSDSSSPKKPRFDTRNPAALVPDAPEEDEVLDADEIGKRGQQTKRNAVNIDGYASDSSNEGFDARAEAKARRTQDGSGVAGSKDEEDNDMFAELEDDFADKDKHEGAGGKRKKTVKFLDVDEIDGQVQHSQSGGHVKVDLRIGNGGLQGAGKGSDIESSSDSEVGDEERAAVDEGMDEELGAGSKKKHAPKIDAFNLKAETEDGGFDEHGNYVRKAQDPDAVYDSWMEGLSKKDLKKARQAQADRRDEQRQKRLADDSVTDSEIYKVLITRLERGETVLEALARLGKRREKPKRQTKGKSSRNGRMESDQGSVDDASAETKRREAVESITWAADLLMSRDNPEVYEMDRELLMRLYRRETGEDWNDASNESPTSSPVIWEYKWSDARDGGQVHGPYDGATMLAWNDAGYFGENVEFRKAGDDSSHWGRSVQF